jgi:hypothetical protein
MRVWLGGSVALACAAMAAALYLSDLEKLSWIASAGSFVTGVSSLVLAYALTRPPASRPELPSSAPTDSEPVPVVIYLTTTATRIGARAADVLLGVVLAAGVCIGLGGILFVVFYLQGQSAAQQWAEIQAIDPTSVLLLMLFLAGIWVTSESSLNGEDTLIVDASGVTIIDKRWIRRTNRSVSLSWDHLASVRVRPDPNNAAGHLMIASFENTDAAAQPVRHHALPRVDEGLAHGGHALLRLSTENTEMLSTVRAALARYGGEKYQRSS